MIRFAWLLIDCTPQFEPEVRFCTLEVFKTCWTNKSYKPHVSNKCQLQRYYFHMFHSLHIFIVPVTSLFHCFHTFILSYVHKFVLSYFLYVSHFSYFGAIILPQHCQKHTWHTAPGPQPQQRNGGMRPRLPFLIGGVSVTPVSSTCAKLFN